MRIAFLTPEYITESNFDGGLANYLYRVTHTLLKRGHDIEVFTYSQEDGDILHDNIPVHCVKTEVTPLFNFINKLARYKLTNSIRILALSYAMKKRFFIIHRQNPFDIIQQSSYLTPGLCLLFNQPTSIVTRISSYQPMLRKFYNVPLSWDERIIDFFENLALRRSHAVYAPSYLLSRILKEKLKVDVEVVRPPFMLENNHHDTSVYDHYLSGKKYFLFFGTIGFLKGGEVLAKTLPNILSRYHDMYFVFAGKSLHGPNNKDMLSYIRDCAGIYKNRIIYLGVLKHDKLYPIISHSVAVVLPSLIDNLPNTMLESMILGKVIIGTKGTSFEELVENEVSGILIEPNNPEELCKAMNYVWNMSENERMKIGEVAQKQISNLSPDISCDRLEKYFAKVIDKKIVSNYE